MGTGPALPLSGRPMADSLSASGITPFLLTTSPTRSSRMPSREPASLPCLGVVAASSLLFLALGGRGGDGSGIHPPPTTGTLQVTTTTTGDDPDPDGYTVRLDGGEGQPIGVAATIERSELEPRADHTLLLEGLAPNCSVEENPRTVPITAGQTTTSTFAVVCT